jgi:hypothetical protein
MAALDTTIPVTRTNGRNTRLEALSMSKRLDGAVLVVASLAAFFATFFGVLLMLRGEPAATPTFATADPPHVSAAPPVIPDVSRAVSEAMSPPVASRASARHALAALEQLGVTCAEGADCSGP